MRRESVSAKVANGSRVFAGIGPELGKMPKHGKSLHAGFVNACSGRTTGMVKGLCAELT